MNDATQKEYFEDNGPEFSAQCPELVKTFMCIETDPEREVLTDPRENLLYPKVVTRKIVLHYRFGVAVGFEFMLDSKRPSDEEMKEYRPYKRVNSFEELINSYTRFAATAMKPMKEMTL